jgi:ABC-2 type transport system permease protein
VERLRTAAGLFLWQAQVKLQRLMQYRADFFIGVFVSFGFSLMGPLFQFLLYTRTRGYPGWSWSQILLFQGVLLLVGGLRDTLFGEVQMQIDRLMDKGEFDQLLLKPCPPLLNLLVCGFSPKALGTLLVGGSAVTWAWLSSGSPVTLSAILLFLLFLGASILLFSCASIFYCSLTVRWIYTMRLGEMLGKVLMFSDFPLNVYPLALRTVFVTVLPFSIAIHWPAQALLGRLEPGAWIAFCATVAAWALSYMFWLSQMKRYSSGGG